MNFVKPQSASDKYLRKLLLKCLLSHDVASSVRAFAEWEKGIVYDDLDFQSFSLLSAVYLKLLELDESSRDFGLRIKGAYRRTWTENNLFLNELKKMVESLKTERIQCLVADESIRLVEIFNDLGVFPLQSFLVVASTRFRKDLCRTVSNNHWTIVADEIENTLWQKDKVLNMRILWKCEAEFAAQWQRAEMIYFKDDSHLVLCAEEQILNLCAGEFAVYGDDASRWQFIVSALFNHRKINLRRLISLAEKRGLTQQTALMLGNLKRDFNAGIPTGLLNDLRQSRGVGRIFLIKQKIKNLSRSYRMYSDHEKRANANFVDFLEKRWKTSTRRALILHAVKSSLKLLQVK